MTNRTFCLDLYASPSSGLPRFCLLTPLMCSNHFNKHLFPYSSPGGENILQPSPSITGLRKNFVWIPDFQVPEAPLGIHRSCAAALLPHCQRDFSHYRKLGHGDRGMGPTSLEAPSFSVSPIDPFQLAVPCRPFRRPELSPRQPGMLPVCYHRFNSCWGPYGQPESQISVAFCFHFCVACVKGDGGCGPIWQARLRLGAGRKFRGIALLLPAAHAVHSEAPVPFLFCLPPASCSLSFLLPTPSRWLD